MFVKSVLLIVYVLGVISGRGFYFRFRDNVDDSFNIVPVKLSMKMLNGERMFATNDHGQ